MVEQQRGVYHRLNDDIDEALGISRHQSNADSSLFLTASAQRLNSLVAKRLREIVAFGITNAVEIRKILR